MAKRPGLAALLLAAPKKGDGEDSGDEGDDTYAEEDDGEDYKALAEEAFPDEEWTPERVSALKEFVMKCMG